jgi:GTPase SAR1 family protein
VKWQWFKEVTHHCPDKPIIVLALQTDRRTDKATIEMFDRARQGHIVTPEEGMAMAKELRARRYLECSAVMQQGSQEVLKALVEVGTNGKQVKSQKISKKTNRECIVM